MQYIYFWLNGPYKEVKFGPLNISFKIFQKRQNPLNLVKQNVCSFYFLRVFCFTSKTGMSMQEKDLFNNNLKSPKDKCYIYIYNPK